MVVIYAEKSSLAKSIAETLKAGKRLCNSSEPTIGWWKFQFNGEQAILCHGAGHLCTSVDAQEYGEQYKQWDLRKYPCIPDELKIKVKDSTKACYNTIAEFFKQADWLINATDPDREGELIFKYIYDTLNCKQMWKRVILEDTTTSTIYKAFHHLIDGTQMLPLQMSGMARDYADWIIGINLTVAMTKKFGDRENIFTLGRVQTPTLNLIVQRELAIKNHIKQPFWKLLSSFDVNGIPLNTEYKNGSFEQKNIAEKILSECNQVQKGTVISKIQKTRKVSAPKLYNATQLRSACNRKFGWSLKETDKVMQALYEHRLMTYPRSSSEYLPDSMKNDVTDTLNKLFQTDMYKQYKTDNWKSFGKRHFDDSKVGSHTAIIPTTNVPSTLDNISPDEQKLYDLLVKSVIRMIYPDAEIEETTLDITVGNNIFHTKGNVIKEYGWYTIDAMPKETTLPECNEGDIFYGKFTLKEGQTEPPKRYTQATLIEEMELAGKRIVDEETRALMLKNHMGIGTEATRTSVIQQLFTKGYIAEKGKSIYATEKGIYLINTLTVPDLKSAEMTGELEKKLNDIANGRYSYEEYIREIQQKTKEWYAAIVNTNANVYQTEDSLLCPFCGRIMKMQKFGLSCTGYFDKTNPCNFSIAKEICKKKITSSQMKMLINSGRTRIIKGFVGKNGTEFNASLLLNKSTKKITFEFEQKKHKTEDN